MKIFLSIFVLLFIKPILGLIRLFWEILKFFFQIIFYKAVFKIIDWIFRIL